MNKFIWALAASVFILHSCNEAEKSTSSSKEERSEQTELSDREKESDKSIYDLNIEVLVEDIDAKREEIESRISAIEPLTLNTDNMREKIHQKWSKIDIYAENGEVLRVKTYPHEGISQRTEEFYFVNEDLILAVIEDNGSGERGKSSEELDKMYYYHEGLFIKERNQSSEKEYSIKKSESEKLYQEAIEYLDLYRENLKSEA